MYIYIYEYVHIYIYTYIHICIPVFLGSLRKMQPCCPVSPQVAMVDLADCTWDCYEVSTGSGAAAAKGDMGW